MGLSVYISVCMCGFVRVCVWVGMVVKVCCHDVFSLPCVFLPVARAVAMLHVTEAHVA